MILFLSLFASTAHAGFFDGIADGTEECTDCPSGGAGVHTRTDDDAYQTDMEMAKKLREQQAKIDELTAAAKKSSRSSTARSSTTSSTATPASASASATTTVDLLTVETLLADIKVSAATLIEKAEKGGLNDQDRELMASYARSFASIIALLKTIDNDAAKQTALLTEIRDLLRDQAAQPVPNTSAPAPSASSDQRVVRPGFGVALGVDGMDPKDRAGTLVSGHAVMAIAWDNSSDGAAFIGTLGLGVDGTSIGTGRLVYHRYVGERFALGGGLYGDFQCYGWTVSPTGCLGNSKVVGLTGLMAFSLDQVTLTALPYFAVGQHEPYEGEGGREWRGGVMVPVMFWP